MTFDQQWIEFDYNPFILFNSNGKIASLNSEAQFLLGNVTAKSIYELATTYANESFGFKTTFLDLEYGRYRFFGITVGYETEDTIGIRLYQMPTYKFSKPKENAELVNIYNLIDLCISSNSIGNDIEFIRNFDPTLPELRLQTDPFIKMVNKIIQAMKTNQSIHFKIYFRVGEHVKFEGIKYSLFSLEVKAESFNIKMQSEIEVLAQENNLFIEFNKSKIGINIPILSD
jgi:nitrogen-specific signal transduction histidine kinase